MLTAYGKALRKLRIDRQELLKEMAERLKVSSAYLSAVETGKRRIPQNWTDLLVEEYQLDRKVAQELRDAEEVSSMEVRISLEGASDLQRSAALTFAKALDGLSDDELKKIMSSMKGKGRGNHLA